MSGYITYIEYQYGIDKGGIHNGDRISSPFGFDTPDTDYAAKAEYTGSRVVETYTAGAAGATQTIKPFWGSTNYDNFDKDGVKRTEKRSSVIIEKVVIGDTEYKIVNAAPAAADEVQVTPKTGDDLGIV